MQLSMVYELNSTYMSISGEEIDNSDNYRYKMMEMNDIHGLLPLEIRTINNDRKIFVDISGKESILNYFNVKTATRNEVKSLFDAIYIISDEMNRFLIGETDIAMTPEMIFKNLRTGDFEFICVPLTDTNLEANESMKSLVHFLMMHLDNDDEKLVNAIYSISAMYEKSKPQFSLVYDYFCEETREEPDLSADTDATPSYSVSEPVKHTFYIPSLREVLTAVMGIAGISLIGINVYLSGL